MRPAMIIISPQIMNAPTASANPNSGIPLDAKRAAPGVDHAIQIGLRLLSERKMAESPIAMATAINPEAACASVAPALRSP